VRIRLDKIASSTRNAKLSWDVQLSSDIVAEEGYVIAARVLVRKDHYNQLEDVHGRMVKIQDDDLIAGVLGARRALRGFAGYVPSSVHVGDRLSILNLGGVIGTCVSSSDEVGDPIPVEVLGAVLTFPSIEERIGVPAHIRNGPVPLVDEIGPSAPVIYVSGTCMNTGKTTACAEIIRELNHRGYRVGAAKLTGVSLLRDTMQMEDCGAVKGFNFTDAGVISTAGAQVIPVAKGILRALQAWYPNVIVAELGDGLAGEYGVATILENEELMSIGCAHVLCASDPVAAWGGARFFQERFGREIALVTGPATDNDIGSNYIRRSLGIPAWNARVGHKELVDLLEMRLRPSVTTQD
jgi:hypothetical protein